MSLTKPIQNGSWAPEHQLLRASAQHFIHHCNGVSGDSGQPFLVDEVKEDELLRMGGAQGLFPTVRDYLRDRDLMEHFSAAFGRALHRAARKQHMDSLGLVGNLLEVLALLEEAGIAVIPFKGPALSAALFGDVGYRRSVDLDLFLPKEAIRQAKDLLLAQGFEPQYALGPREEQAYINSGLAYGFRHEARACLVELHWTLLPLHNASTIPPELVWERSEEKKILGRNMRQIDDRLLLVYLCLHASKHQWSKMKWIIDVARMLQQCTDQKIEDAMGLAAQLGCQRVLNVGILLSEALLSVTISPGLRKKVGRDAIAEDLASEIITCWMFKPEEAKDFGDLAWYHLRERERWRDKLPLLKHDVGLALKPSDKDRAFVRLPASLSFLYPLVRPARLVSERVQR